MTAPNHIPDDDDYYALTAADKSESPSTVQVLIEDKPIDIMVATWYQMKSFNLYLGEGGSLCHTL